MSPVFAFKAPTPLNGAGGVGVVLSAGVVPEAEAGGVVLDGGEVAVVSTEVAVVPVSAEDGGGVFVFVGGVLVPVGGTVSLVAGVAGAEVSEAGGVAGGVAVDSTGGFDAGVDSTMVEVIGVVVTTVTGVVVVSTVPGREEVSVSVAGGGIAEDVPQLVTVSVTVTVTSSCRGQKFFCSCRWYANLPRA